MKPKKNYVLKRNFASKFAKCKEYEKKICEDDEKLLQKIMYADVEEVSIDEILKVFERMSELSRYIHVIESYDYADDLVKRLLKASHFAQRRVL